MVAVLSLVPESNRVDSALVAVSFLQRGGLLLRPRLDFITLPRACRVFYPAVIEEPASEEHGEKNHGSNDGYRQDPKDSEKHPFLERVESV